GGRGRRKNGSEDGDEDDDEALSQVRRQCQPRYTTMPRVGSYGVSATVTLSPSTTRMRCLRSLPPRWASTWWPFSSSMRKFPAGSTSMTRPWNSMCSSRPIGGGNLTRYGLGGQQ